MANEDRLQKARASLERVQLFDPATLPREAQLGGGDEFSKCRREPAKQVIDLFRQYPLDFLSNLPNSQLDQLTQSADAFHQQLTEFSAFDPKQPDSYARRTQMITNLEGQYQTYFDRLYPLISYGSSRQRDFASMERDFRASMQRAQDKANNLLESLSGQQEDAKRILEEVRKVAAEQGVSQQASYFAEESKSHETQATKWHKWTIWTAVGLGLYAVLH